MRASANSSTLVPILSAYAAAKTPAEVDAVLRRARVASYSGSLSKSEKEVLSGLTTRHERRKADSIQNQSGGMSSSSSTATLSNSNLPSSVHSTPRSNVDHTPVRASRTLASSVSSAPGQSLSELSSSASMTNSLPRKTRASITTTSSTAKAARDIALLSNPRQARLSTSGFPSRSPAHTPALTDSAGSSPSVTPSIDEEERLGDEEMEAYIQRQQQKRLANGAKMEELEKMLNFPDPVAPSRPLSPRRKYRLLLRSFRVMQTLTFHPSLSPFFSLTEAEVMYGDKLAPYELKEIYDYDQIYFCGNPSFKKTYTVDKPANNFGFDDERGDYLVNNNDHLAYRYEIMDMLGKGSFGQVLQCKDHRTGKSVAVKLIRNKKRFHHQALVEVKILESLTKWDPDEQFNVIKMTESFYFRNHLCIAMELLSINLYELIKANSFAGFTTKLIRRFTTQALASLSLMRRHQIVHCDLKPENILLMHPRKSGIKVIDFGSSCFENEKGK